MNQKINNNIEANLRINLQNFFETQKNRIIAELEKYYNEEYMLQGQIDLILAPIHEAQKEYYEMLLESNLAMYQRGMSQGQRLYNLAEQTRESHKSTKSPFDFNKRELFGTLTFSEDYLTDYTFTASQKTIDRVDSEINQILTDGYKDGWGVKDVRNRIIERYDQFKGWEANRIARTEMQTAHNMGVMRTYFDLEVDYIQWRSAHDMRVRGLKRTDRADHIKMDGEITKLGENFSNGLQYPGDKRGKIEEWINCRCSAIPFLMPPGKAAPSFAPFRETDLVDVKEPIYGQLLKKETEGAMNWLDYKKVLQGKSDVSEFVPSHPNGDLISLNDLLFNDGKQMYVSTIVNPKSKLNPATGKWEYKGLEADDKEGVFLFFKKESIEQHNSQLIENIPSVPQGDIINTNDLTFVPTSDMYMASTLDPHSKLNSNTNIWEYKGLEADFVDGSIIYLKKESIDKHNDQFLQSTTPEPINVNELDYNPDTGYYTVDISLLTLNEATGKYELKGLEMDSMSTLGTFGKVSKTKVDEWNAQFSTVTPINEPIDTSELHFNETTGNYIFLKSKLDYDENTGKYYYKGIEATMVNSVDTGNVLYGKIPKEVIDEHNAQFETNQSTPVKEVITETDLQGLYYSIPNHYYTFYDFTEGVEKIGDAYYFKGLDITPFHDEPHEWFDVPEDVINKHNEELNVTTQTSNEPKGEFIDPYLLEQNKAPGQHNYKIPISEVDIIPGANEFKYEYKGLELDMYDTAFEVGKIMPDSLAEHNKQFPDAKAYIDTSILHQANVYKGYTVDANDPDITYDRNTDTHYYKGAKIEKWYDTYGIILETDIIKHNLIVQNTPIPSPSTDPEIIDTTQLHKLETTSAEEYFVTEYDGAVYEGNLKWKWKGETWTGNETGFYLFKADLDAHNSQFQTTTEDTENEITDKIISLDTFDMVKTGEFTYVVNENADGFELKEDGAYYKGIELDVLFTENGEPTYILSTIDVDNYNLDLIFGDLNELPHEGQLQSKLTDDEYLKYENLLTEIKKKIKKQTSDSPSYSQKLALISQVKIMLPEFNELKKKALAKPIEFIDVNELIKIDGKYAIDNDEGAVYKGNNIWEWKGVEWFGDEHYLKLTDEQIDEHNQKIIEKIKELEPAQYEDGWVVTSEHGIAYNSETDKWEYKGIELKYYDEVQDIGILEENTLFNLGVDVSDINTQETNSSTSELEPIDYAELDIAEVTELNNSHYGEYFIEETEGAVYNDSTGFWEWKGTTWSGSHFGFYITDDDITQHNQQIQSQTQISGKEYIDPSMLLFDSNLDYYKLEKSLFEYNPNFGIYEYKGYKITMIKYINSGHFIYIPKADLEAHNYEAINGVPMSAEDSTVTYAEISQLKTDADGDYMFYGNPGDYDNQLYFEDIIYNEDEDKYYWKGIPMDYYDGIDYGYIEAETMEQYMLDNEITAPLTYQDIQELEEYETPDGYYEFDIEDTIWHKSDLKYNENTGFWEFKGVEVDDFDEDYWSVQIDVNKVEEYKQYNTIPINLNSPPGSGLPVGRADAVPNNNNHNIFGSYLLEHVVENGIGYVIDENGDKWEIDKLPYNHAIDGGHLEDRQDRIQDVDAYNKYRDERDSVAHWGQYGHQNIGNFFYPDSPHGWDEYEDLKNNRVLPLLNKMRDKLLIIYDPDASSTSIQAAERQYQELWRQYAEMVDEIYDDTGDSNLRTVLWEIAYIDSAIAKTPELEQDTALVRYGHFDESMCELGEIFDLEGFLSTSYDDVTREANATDHFARKCHRWKITILAPKGTRGIRLNNFFHALTSEREWLLDRNQKFEVLEYNLDDEDYGDTFCKRQGYKRKRVTIRLIND